MVWLLGVMRRDKLHLKSRFLQCPESLYLCGISFALRQLLYLHEF